MESGEVNAEVDKVWPPFARETIDSGRGETLLSAGNVGIQNVLPLQSRRYRTHP